MRAPFGFASLSAGIAAIPAEASAAVVLLADMPFVEVQMIRAVVERYRDTSSSSKEPPILTIPFRTSTCQRIIPKSTCPSPR